MHVEKELCCRYVEICRVGGSAVMKCSVFARLEGRACTSTRNFRGKEQSHLVMIFFNYVSVQWAML